MEESAEILKNIEVFERKASELLHKKSDIIELEIVVMDIVAAAEKNGFRKGVMLMAAL